MGAKVLGGASLTGSAKRKRSMWALTLFDEKRRGYGSWEPYFVGSYNHSENVSFIHSAVGTRKNSKG